MQLRAKTSATVGNCFGFCYGNAEQIPRAPASKKNFITTCDRFLGHVPGVHGQRLVGVLATKHKIHAVFGLRVAHFDRATVNLNSKASLEHGRSSVDGDKVHEAKAAAQVAAAFAHDAHLSDAGAVPRKHGQNGIFVRVDIETLRTRSHDRENEGMI